MSVFLSEVCAVRFLCAFIAVITAMCLLLPLLELPNEAKAKALRDACEDVSLLPAVRQENRSQVC